MPGSSTILPDAIPALPAMSSERVKERGDILHDVDRSIGAVAVVHDDNGAMARRHQCGHIGIALQAPDVVGDRRTGIKRPGDNRRFHAVDRYGNAERNHPGQDRLQALSFLIGETGWAP
jgi:hypothetical protein